MIGFAQETSSNQIFNLIYGQFSYPASNPVLETRVSRPNRYFISPPESSALIGNAWDICSEAKNQEVMKQSRTLLALVQEIIFSFEQLGFYLGSLPSFQAVETDDKSILIEWIFLNFRIGFDIEPNPAETGWYLVSSEALGNVNALGYIKEKNLEKTFLWLLNYAISNQ